MPFLSGAPFAEPRSPPFLFTPPAAVQRTYNAHTWKMPGDSSGTFTLHAPRPPRPPRISLRDFATSPRATILQKTAPSNLVLLFPHSGSEHVAPPLPSQVPFPQTGSTPSRPKEARTTFSSTGGMGPVKVSLIFRRPNSACRISTSARIFIHVGCRQTRAIPAGRSMWSNRMRRWSFVRVVATGRRFPVSLSATSGRRWRLPRRYCIARTMRAMRCRTRLLSLTNG
ncbi:MAG: hypothetical protein JWM97_3112 [Phycisphaerales bacterium]|nr:hypothetical protein [Phycisphaerales bacterium]